MLPCSSGELKFMFGTYTFVYLIILTVVSQIYKSWSLHDSNSTRTGACITQNQKDLRSRKLNHKHSYRQVGLQQCWSLLRFIMFIMLCASLIVS